jgi:hypothetical protein
LARGSPVNVILEYVTEGKAQNLGLLSTQIEHLQLIDNTETQYFLLLLPYTFDHFTLGVIPKEEFSLGRLTDKVASFLEES